MYSKVTWTEEDDYDDPLAPEGGAPAPLANRMNRVVVLKGMFTVEDLDKDASLLVELKEDVREEAETLGVVTSLQLYYVRHLSNCMEHPLTGAERGRWSDDDKIQRCILGSGMYPKDERPIFRREKSELRHPRSHYQLT